MDLLLSKEKNSLFLRWVAQMIRKSSTYIKSAIKGSMGIGPWLSNMVKPCRSSYSFGEDILSFRRGLMILCSLLQIFRSPPSPIHFANHLLLVWTFINGSADESSKLQSFWFWMLILSAILIFYFFVQNWSVYL